MEYVLPVLMGVSLAACAGLRAFLPLLVTGVLARAGYLTLGEGYSLLARTDMLVVFAVASIVEIVADKIPLVDHVLDSAATFLRPAAGTLLVAALANRLDPALALTLGLITGGTTALTVHAGKAAARTLSTASAPAHAGLGNTALSFAEDSVAGVGIGLAAVAPLVAFGAAVLLVLLAVNLGKRAMRIWRGNRRGTA